MAVHNVTPEQFAEYAGQLYQNYNGAAFIEWEKSVKMNKGGRAGVAPNPIYGMVTRKMGKTVLLTSQSYTDRVRAEQEKAGVDADFKAQKKSTYEPLTEYGFTNCAMLERNVNNGCIYLVYYNPMADDYTREFSELSELDYPAEFYVNGELATPEDMETIRAYGGISDAPAWKTSGTQAAAGVDDSAHQQYRNINLNDAIKIIIGREEFVFVK